MQEVVEEKKHLDALLIWVTDPFKIWSSLCIPNIIPLGRFEWHWASNGHSSRDSSATARVFFKVLSSLPLQELHQEPQDYYLNPYVQIFVISLDLLDKSAGNDSWNRLRAFLESCRSLRLEYLVLFSAADEDLTQRKRLVDKLRAEVNHVSRESDRVVNVLSEAANEDRSSATHVHHSAVHRQFLIQLREVMRMSVQDRLRKYDAEVGRLYVNRRAPSWSYTRFFALSEGMAFVLLILGKRDLALKQYENLNTVLSEEKIYCGTFCNEPAAEAALGISNSNLRDYRTLLLNSAVTEIDIHTYNFARQMDLLLSDRKYIEIAEKGVKLIIRISKRCTEEIATGKSCITQVFRDIWIFTASRLIAVALTPAVPAPNETSQEAPSQLGTIRERHTVRLIAGFHVHSLKALQNLARVVLPGCLCPDDLKVPNREALVQEAVSTSNEKLKVALSSRKSAETLYSEIANAAASLYEMGHRARGAAALDGDAGRVHLLNGSFNEAEALLGAQCARFTNDQGWDLLHKRQRKDLASTEKQLKRTQEYLVSCLTMLYMCRTSRLLDPLSYLSEDEIRQLREETSFWISETMKLAGDLPRMMRYKAERLFKVSVLSNSIPWEDGSSGSATIRIKLDLLADIKIDYVLLECKCMDVPSMRKSALHRRDKLPRGNHESDSSESPVNVTSPGNNSPTSLSTMSLSDTFCLKSEDFVVLQTGINDVTVSAAEVPHSGRYRVTNVSLFLGKLKFVHSFGNIGINPIAGTQKASNAKVSFLSPPLVDHAIVQAQAPFLFASRRSLSAIVELDECGFLYLIPRAHQYICLKITAGERGIANGSKVTCSLFRPDDETGSSNGNATVKLFSGRDASSSNIDRVLSFEANEQSAEDGKTSSGIGKATILEELLCGQTLTTKIALGIIGEDANYKNAAEASLKAMTYVFNFELEWHELHGNTNRKFSNCKSKTLTLVSPVEITACLEMNSEWGLENVSTGIGRDGTPLGDGGTLTCSIYSRTKFDDNVTIRSVVLQTPDWLELRPDEDPAHMSLLPCSLQTGSLLSCSFDMFLREETRREDNGRAENGEVYGMNAMKHRLSRRLVKQPDISRVSDENNVRGDGKMISDNPSINVEDMRGKADNSHEQRTGRNMLKGEENLSDGDYEAVGNDPFIGDIGTEHAAEVVVDLSSGEKSSGEKSSGEKSSGEKSSGENAFAETIDKTTLNHTVGWHDASEANSFAELQVELKIDKVSEWTTVKRRISLAALRRLEKRYGIERQMKSVGEVGKILDLKFRVWCMGGGGGSDRTETLQYEIIADPCLWIIVGQQRGQIEATVGWQENDGGKVHTKLLPLEGGLHSVPHIKLFGQDGHPIPFSICEDVDEYMQVAIASFRTVMSASCVVDTNTGDDRDGDAIASGGTLPDVIASDSFFA